DHGERAVLAGRGGVHRRLLLRSRHAGQLRVPRRADASEGGRDSRPVRSKGREVMPRLVSHPDEVIVLKRRFGQGAASIDRYIELDGYAAVQKAIAQGADATPARITDTMK